MTGRESLELGEQLRTAIGDLARKARASDELPTNHAAALGHLDRTGPATIAELAHACRIRHQSMTAIVQHISARHEAVPEPHPTDRRAVLYRITEEGRAELNRDRKTRAGWLAEAIERNFPTDLTAIENTIRVLRVLGATD